jgi:hypothetical protein
MRSRKPASSVARDHAGCNVGVAEAAIKFYKQSAPFSMRSRRYPIVRLVESLIDQPWSAYVSRLPDTFAGKRICKGWVPSELIGTKSLSSIEDLIIVTVSLVDKCRPEISEQQQSELRGSHPVTWEEKSLFDEFSATLSTIREIACTCKMKKPRKTVIGKFNARRKRVYCAFCSEHTELASALVKLEGAAARGDRTEFAPDERLKLSSRYCENHRPRRSDLTWNPSYKQAYRSKAEFISLMNQIECHVANVPTFSVPLSQGIGNPFLWLLARRLGLYLYDEAKIRSLARMFTDYRINGRKEAILFLLVGGMTQSEVAKKLDISRQAVHKVAHSEAYDKFAQLLASTSL